MQPRQEDGSVFLRISHPKSMYCITLLQNYDHRYSQCTKHYTYELHNKELNTKHITIKN